MIFLRFILIVALGLILVQLGSYSVWMAVFSAVIKLASVVIAVLIGLLLWTRIIKKRDHRIYSDFNPQCSKKVH